MPKATAAATRSTIGRPVTVTLPSPPTAEAPPELDPKNRELVDRIEQGAKITLRDQMTDEYYEDLVHLMTMQADSELAGAFGYMPWIAKAPGVEEKLIVANIVRDEVRHAKAVYALLRDLGVDVDSRVDEHDYNFRVRSEGEELGTKRAHSDARVNIFYYPIDSWADFVAFNFLMDRGAGHQLEDGLECSYLPWASELQRVFKEELTHIRHGDMWTERLAKDPKMKAEMQKAIDRWYPRTMNIFGRPKTRRNARYRMFNLKKRDNQEVRQAFHDEVKANCDAWGLTLPEWHPEWEKLDSQERYGA